QFVRICFHRAFRANARDKCTVCAFVHRAQSPGCGRLLTEKSKRLSMPEEWRDDSCATAVVRPESVLYPYQNTRSPARSLSACNRVDCRSHTATRLPQQLRVDRVHSYDRHSLFSLCECFLPKRARN